MTNTKAQVGDLIRISNTEDSRYSDGDIFEVGIAEKGGVHVTKNDMYVYDREYVIHRKAGEEEPEDTIQKTDAFDIMRAGLRMQAELANKPKQDAVNSPQHYTQGRVEVIDIIEDAVQGADPFEAVCQANILKYTLRYRAKNGVEDLNKAKWYMERLIKHLDEMF